MKTEILKLAKENNITYIRLLFTDVLGTLKNVEIPVTELESAIDDGVMFDGSSIKGFVRISETDMRLRPDLNTWLEFEWEGDEYGKVAALFCDVENPDGTPFEGDPRRILRRNLEKMEELGFSDFMIGFEPEFYALKLDEFGHPITDVLDGGGYFDLAPIDSGEDLRREIVMQLTRLGFDMEASHHEVGASQHEINFRFQNALDAADSLQIFKLVVKNIAKKHGMHATFMAKPLKGKAGNGMHTNVSLMTKDGENAFFDTNGEHQLSETAYQFMAGVINNARPITAITNPTVNSYKRLIPGYEAPCYVAWSPSNRSTFIRIPVARGKGTRIEVRSVDPTANAYLALSAILAAGLDGIKNSTKCIDPITTDLFKLTRTEREDLGIINLPDNIYDAVKEFKGSELLTEALGPHTSKVFIEAKNKEWEDFKVEVHEWERTVYMKRY